MGTAALQTYFQTTRGERIVDIPTYGLMFHASMDGTHPGQAETGQTITTSGTAVYTTLAGIPCLQHTNGTNCWMSASGSMSTKTGWTVSAWIAYATTTPNRNEAWIFGPSSGTWGHNMLLGFNSSNWTIGILRGGGNYNIMKSYSPASTQQWVHLAGTVDFVAGEAKIYLNGSVLGTSGKTVVDTYDKSYTEARIGTDYAGDSRGVRGTYKLAGCRIYNCVLPQVDIELLAHEFAPVYQA